MNLSIDVAMYVEGKIRSRLGHYTGNNDKVNEINEKIDERPNFSGNRTVRNDRMELSM